MPTPLIISFFTDDWEYPQHAARFKAECDALGLKYFVERKESTKDYIKNTGIKPFYIRECVQQFRRPVCWIDIDAMILKKIVVEMQDFDFAACKYSNRRLQREWAVATLCFNHTPNALKFLDLWCENSLRGTDEASFDTTWHMLRKEMKVFALPNTYNFVRWSLTLQIPEDTVICHQLSKSEDKLRRKYKGHSKS